MKNFIKNFFAIEPRTKREIIQILRDVTLKKVIDNDLLSMLEAVIYIDNLQVRDIMIPRQQMDVIDINSSITDVIDIIIRTGHSRFPVINGSIGEVLGIFHSKDLIQYFNISSEFDIKNHLRKACFVPEIKRIDSLMYEMRLNHAHIAVVVDEFTNVVGLVTLEMIIEQIIGDIEDEYDEVEGERFIIEIAMNKFRIKGYAKLDLINTKIHLQLNDPIVETIGGFIIKFLGRVPLVGEIINFENLRIEIISADSRKINLIFLEIVE